MHDPGLAHLGPMHPLSPKAGHAHHDLQSTLPPIGTITGVANVLIDGIDHGPVPMNFFKRNLPFVVAFFPVHRHHRKQGRPVFEPQFTGIGDGFVKLTITVLQQLPGNPSRSGSQIKGDAVGFGIPIGGATVFLSGKTLGANIKSMIQTVVGLVQMKNVKTYPLLRFGVAFDLNIRLLP